ncbi:hypothetical protein OG730_17840 [Streptomyces sp. NBC_01298]|uniref:hypothetical protein n=1 Tax=Streptomyces sp. NBC_01298 TaxID=2903817 RepID=UPI002E0F0F4F|nr:hypothetical protein OG730_17840 [Streptomyces sp. NBC_01298]
MTTSPSGEAPCSGPGTAPAAAGLGMLSLGGWLLTTTRPWQKPGSPLALSLEWTASGTLMLCGLVLLARCVRQVHGAPEPEREAPDGAPDGIAYGAPRVGIRGRIRPWERPSKGR